MRTVTFIRHAKSDHSHDLPDFERPLNKRGLDDAPMMGKAMQEKFIMPDLIISSPAVRAKTTARLIATELGYAEENICFREDLYFANNSTYYEIINALDEEIKHVYIVSHNPGTTYIVNQISNTRLDNMPTCGMAQIAFDYNNWQDISDKSGILKAFDMPGNHK